VPSLRIYSLVLDRWRHVRLCAEHHGSIVAWWRTRPFGIPGAPCAKNMDTGSTPRPRRYVGQLLASELLLAITNQRPQGGFQALTVSRLPLLSAQTLRQDVTLQVGAVQQSMRWRPGASDSHDSQTLAARSAPSGRRSALAGRSIDSLLACARRRDLRDQSSHFWKLLLGRNQFHSERASVMIRPTAAHRPPPAPRFTLANCRRPIPSGIQIESGTKARVQNVRPS